MSQPDEFLKWNNHYGTVNYHLYGYHDENLKLAIKHYRTIQQDFFNSCVYNVVYIVLERDMIETYVMFVLKC